MAKGFAIVAYVVGPLGLGVLCAYVIVAGFGWRPSGETGAAAWLVDFGWLAIFALQHSGMARRPFKEWWTLCVPATMERSIYVAASGIVTLAQPLVWQQLSGENLWERQWWLIPVSLAGLVGVGLCFRTIDNMEFFGMRQAGFGRPAAEGDTLRTCGAYRWVRHPLMLATLAFLWAQPTMPPELLLLNGGLTAYVLIAIRLEERDLVRQFGQAYVDYRRRVPALVPWRLGR